MDRIEDPQSSDTGSYPVGATIKDYMEESEYISRLIWEWAEARAAADENTKLMVERDFSAAVMEECAKRMKRLGYAEDEMLLLTHSIPQELQNYIDARIDSACSICWTSVFGPKHSECGRKIDRFFLSQEKLYEYARRECDPAKQT